ncbi:NADH-quinone oxidoreductase subunit K [Nannocystis radixulma]|uniref:NADH-quinone oxidoreductase subunit K n=1 Tax=Nannocystis radixulma TaxID=2995305 RepID=A0ABT5B4R8_9BACT|nr:NADH-quinone oxidoreductase subunit K [Nannocystis radixulma]MDC0669091.1 NADH-quinone oxidoreductase subunit K [Nannocystis radixulma]
MPITHAYYLASGLWLLGLAGVLLRRDGWGRAVSLAVMLLGAATLLVGAARAWALADGHALAALLFALAGAYAVVLATLQAPDREGS